MSDTIGARGHSPDEEHRSQMKNPRWKHSLKSRIVVSYSLILIVGGLSTSLIGIHVTGQALLEQAHQQVRYGLRAGHGIYQNRLRELRQGVELLASSGRLQSALAERRPAAAKTYLSNIRREQRLDFLSVADAGGRVIVRTSGTDVTGGNVAGIAPIARALEGVSVASTEILDNDILRTEDPALAERAALKIVPSPNSQPADHETLGEAMVLLAAAPVTDEDGRIIAVVYAGQLLNDPGTELNSGRGHWIVEKINATLSPASDAPREGHGTATIVQGRVRVTTNITTADGRRAVGTCVSNEVYDTVINRGEPWIGSTFAVNEWFIAGYEPITNLVGDRIGMLCVGLRQRPYTAVRDSVTLAFAGIALFCFVLIVVVTYFLTRSLVRPLEEMVSVSQSIAAGDLTRRSHVTDQSELGLLSGSFNDMLDRISQMKSQLEQRRKTLEQKVEETTRLKGELEQWGKTLEQKVEERTQELVKVQTQVARQQRLASVGQLAAGVAHEINNPLGGILMFASLVLEDQRPDSPHTKDLEEIVRQAIRCRKIVTGLLEFSRKREACMAPANINEILFRTLGLLETQAIFHDINVTRKFDPQMPVTVMDESQMQQVFMNTILNAVESMDGQGDLTIETRHSNELKEVFVRITDTGCGIPQENREAIFDPFFTTKDPGKGTGLGLAVACRIIEEHGGRMDLESEVGKGTSFTILLPMSAG